MPRTPSPEATALLQETLNYITTHPGQHDQRTWLWGPSGPEEEQLEVALLDTGNCGTTGCLAGWGVVHSGYRPVRVGLGGDVLLAVPARVAEHIQNMLLNGDMGEALELVTRIGSPVRQVAKRVFDLTTEQADALFGSDRTLAEPWALAYVFTAGAIVLPEQLPEGSPWPEWLPGEPELKPRTVREQVAAALKSLARSGLYEDVNVYVSLFDIRHSVAIHDADRWLVYS